MKTKRKLNKCLTMTEHTTRPRIVPTRRDTCRIPVSRFKRNNFIHCRDRHEEKESKWNKEDKAYIEQVCVNCREHPHQEDSKKEKYEIGHIPFLTT